MGWEGMGGRMGGPDGMGWGRGGMGWEGVGGNAKVGPRRSALRLEGALLQEPGEEALACLLQLAGEVGP